MVLTDEVEELLAGLDGGASLRSQTKTALANGAEMRSPGSDDPFTDN